MLQLYLFSTAICMPSSLLRSRCTRLKAFYFFSSLFCSSFLCNKLTSIFTLIPYTGKLWNSPSLFVFPPVYDLNSFTLSLLLLFLLSWTLSKEECQDSSNAKMNIKPLLLFLVLSSLYRVWRQAGFSNVFLLSWPVYFLSKKTTTKKTPVCSRKACQGRRGRAMLRRQLLLLFFWILQLNTQRFLIS